MHLRQAAAAAQDLNDSPFVLVTGNPNKLAEARRLTGLDVDSVALDLPEVQSLSYEEVVRAKAAEAWRRVGPSLGRPLVVEEAGLGLAALNGFPGPLVKWMLEAAGAEAIARTALALGDPRATATCLLLWKDADHEILAVGNTDGTLVAPGRGANGFGFDPVFSPGDTGLTYGELADAEKDATSHRGRAWRALLKLLGRG
ncbi:MAG TPA: non-canonical purine NTP pyrophosphatase [Thermoanaerobaculia bacterium]|nr:non-canonical purine NTP pyrophosphatase [Thermoanaerobaculia bacterium]